MGAAENAALVRRVFDAWARKDGYSLREVFAEDCVWVVPGGGTMAGVYRGRHEIFRFLSRLPKETGGTYGSRLLDVLAGETHAAGLYRASGTRRGRTLDLDQLLLFAIRDATIVEVTALPTDPVAFDEFWAP